jgi:hypothetical protein
MTEQGWRAIVERAAIDDRMRDLLVKLLTEQDAAKSALRRKGYGCTGMGWLETVREVPPTSGDDERGPRRP